MYVLVMIAQTESRKDEIEGLLIKEKFLHHIIEKVNEDSVFYEIYVTDAEMEAVQNAILFA